MNRTPAETARIARPTYDQHGHITGHQPPASGIYAALTRPPLGPPLAGRRATAGGRGNRRSQTDEAKSARFALAWQAWHMRVIEGASLREIAAAVGRSPSTVGRWLWGVPAVGGATSARLAADVERLAADVDALVARSERSRADAAQSS
jgi:hypothetical protein